jgi:hypothetical protein
LITLLALAWILLVLLALLALSLLPLLTLTLLSLPLLALLPLLSLLVLHKYAPFVFQYLEVVLHIKRAMYVPAVWRVSHLLIYEPWNNTFRRRGYFIPG